MTWLKVRAQAEVGNIVAAIRSAADEAVLVHVADLGIDLGGERPGNSLPSTGFVENDGDNILRNRWEDA